jgi:hypothetical protein
VDSITDLVIISDVDDEQRKRLEFFLNQKKLLGELNSEDDFEKLSELGDVPAHHFYPVLRIRDVYPVSRILIFYPSWIPDPKTSEMLKKKIQRIIELFTQKFVTKLLKIWVWDSGSGKNLFRIPDPGVKKAPDPGSGSATLIGSVCFWASRIH